MGMIFLALTVFLLLVNLAGVGLVSERWLGHYPVAKVVGILCFCLLLFHLEHFIGLGKLQWFWPFSTTASGYVLYRYRKRYIDGLWKAELVLAIGFMYGLLWRCAFPDIAGGSEALADLSFVSNYSTGMTLPPQDNWLPGYSFNFYYAFQHYGAALLGRILGLEVGYSLNLAFALLLALLVSLSWYIAGIFCPRWLPKLIVVITVMAGGTGVSPLVPFFYTHHAENRSAAAFSSKTRLWASVRFIGTYENSVTTDFARNILFPDGHNAAREAQDLPLETLGYTTLLGDYHASMGGALILMVALACLLLLEQQPSHADRAVSRVRQRQAVLQAVLVATGPLMLLTNTWVAPLQTALILAWLAYRLLTRQPLCWSAVVTGGLVPLILAYPFLNEFGANMLHTPIRLVAAGQHTPFSRWLLILWPQVLLMLSAVCAAKKYPVAWLLLGIMAFLLGLSELVFVDDPLGGKFNRFNTTLKWWSWLQITALLGLGAVLLGVEKRWMRRSMLAALLLVASYSVDMAYYWVKADKPSFGKLHGHEWLTKDPVNAQMLRYLKVAPRGVVLEGSHLSYGPASALALFANKPSLTGWPGHESQWRGNPPFISQVGREAEQFYQGELPESMQWLAKHQVAYIIWRDLDQQTHAAAWLTIRQQIASEYLWLPFKQHGNVHLGMWRRKCEAPC
jgi:uncharacterized protein DUF2298